MKIYNNHVRILPALIIFVIILSGCGASGVPFFATETPIPTQTFTPSPTFTSTATITPTNTPSPTRTLKPTITPTRKPENITINFVNNHCYPITVRVDDVRLLYNVDPYGGMGSFVIREGDHDVEVCVISYDCFDWKIGTNGEWWGNYTEVLDIPDWCPPTQPINSNVTIINNNCRNLQIYIDNQRVGSVNKNSSIVLSVQTGFRMFYATSGNNYWNPAEVPVYSDKTFTYGGGLGC